jgi:hypothetical protein
MTRIDIQSGNSLGMNISLGGARVWTVPDIMTKDSTSGAQLPFEVISPPALTLFCK